MKELIKAVTSVRGDIAFQLSHAGMSTSRRLIGTTPLAPSGNVANPYSSSAPKEMNEKDILDVIDSCTKAASRAVKAHVKAIQIHSAHGYLLSRFLSPFFNHRHDEWAGSDENRFRLLKEIVVSLKKVLPNNKPLIVKLNASDGLPRGITPKLAATHAKWLEELGVDAIELSAGIVSHSVFNMCRGNVPASEIAQAQPEKYRNTIEESLKKMDGNH